MKNETESNPRRAFVTGAIASLAGGSMALAASNAAAAPNAATRKELHPDGAPAADSGYSPGIEATGGQRVVFVSGQGPEDYDADMETQMRQTFDRIGRVLAEAGAGWEHVVILRSFFVHMERDLPAYRKVRKEYLKKPYPASTAVGTPVLAIPGLDIEIEAVAIV